MMDYLVTRLCCIFLIFYQVNGKFFLIETETLNDIQNVRGSAKQSTGAPLPGRDTFARKVGVISKESNIILM